MTTDETLSKVKNPLAMVAIFAGISEVAMAVVLTQLPDKLQETFLWFVMGFPSVLICIFFLILYRKPAVYFSPGDYKKEELYVSSIGLSSFDKSLTTRVSKLEDTVDALQDFLERSKIQADNTLEYSAVRRNIERTQLLELNPLYEFITHELKIGHAVTQKIISEAMNQNALIDAIEGETQDKRKAQRLRDLFMSFPNSASDFLQLKQSFIEGKQ